MYVLYAFGIILIILKTQKKMTEINEVETLGHAQICWTLSRLVKSTKFDMNVV
jgi:hypothetical protein